MKRISKREKALLYGLCLFVVIIASLYLLVFPILDDCIALEDKIQAAEQEKMDIQLALSNLPIVEHDVEEYAALLETVEGRLYEFRSLAALQRYINSLLDGSNLDILSYNTTMPSFGTVYPFGTQENGASVESVSVTLSCEGTFAQYLHFVNRVASDYALLLNNFSHDFSLNDGKDHIFYVQLTVYLAPDGEIL